MKKILFTMISAMVLWSCKTRQAEPPKTETKNIEKQANTTSENKVFFSQILKKTDFEQIKINSKITAEMGQFVPPLDATFYIEKDKKVWLNASALFLNVARGVATPQGITAYEKWNKTYVQSDFQYLNKMLGVSFINYDALQNLLTGRTFVPIDEQNFAFEKSENGYTLKTKNNQVVKVDGKAVAYQMELQYLADFRLSKVVVNEVSGERNQLEVSYPDWADFGDLILPKNVKIMIKGKKNSQIYIENTKFDFNKMDAPFSVPSNYKKIDIK